MPKGKSLRQTIWNWLLLGIEWTFTSSNLLLTPERKASQHPSQCKIVLSSIVGAKVSRF